jgi:regulator of protease activity HflC (stomatin/prohibitin superfamily)
MADQPQSEYAQPPAEAATQLSQTIVPLNEAEQVFASKDANGLTPLIILTQRLSRMNNTYLMIATIVLAASLLFALLRNNITIAIAGIVIALVLAGLAFFLSLNVTIPEGANGLLIARGKYQRTLQPGMYRLSPWVRVTHLITRREIPFSVPIAEAPTKDNVRVTSDALITFAIIEPYRFVFNISASDFDRVLQAAAQNTLRTMIRSTDSSEISDLPGQDTADLRSALNGAVEPYGVQINKVSITDAHPPPDFQASLEARKLAALQHAEQAEQQALAQRRQADLEALARQAVIAQVERDREALQAGIQAAQSRRVLIDLEAEMERARLEKLQERLNEFPVAAEWDVQSRQLEIAYGLATNTRAVVQVGNASDISRAFIMGDALKDSTLQAHEATNDNRGPAEKREAE